MWCVGLVVVGLRCSCSEACGILVPWPGIKPMPPALQDTFLATSPPGESPLSKFNVLFIALFCHSVFSKLFIDVISAKIQHFKVRSYRITLWEPGKDQRQAKSMSGGQKSIERQAGTRVMHAPLTQDWSTTAESAALGDVTPGPCLPLAPGPRIRNLTSSFLPEEGFPGGSDSKESACNAGDLGSVPGSGRSPREGNGNSNILAWRIPWTEEPGRLQSMGSQRVGHDWGTILLDGEGKRVELNSLWGVLSCSHVLQFHYLMGTKPQVVLERESCIVMEEW